MHCMHTPKGEHLSAPSFCLLRVVLKLKFLAIGTMLFNCTGLLSLSLHGLVSDKQTKKFMAMNERLRQLSSCQFGSIIHRTFFVVAVFILASMKGPCL